MEWLERFRTDRFYSIHHLRAVDSSLILEQYGLLRTPKCLFKMQETLLRFSTTSPELLTPSE